MNKNKAIGIQKSQVISAASEEMIQLDLLSFISDKIVPTDITERKRRTRFVTGREKQAKALGKGHRYYGHVDKNKTFDTFCLGESNKAALEATKRFLGQEKCDFGVIYLMAMSGLGKSHLLHAAANELMEMGKSFYITSPSMLQDLKDPFNELKMYDFLLIDDMEEIAQLAYLQQEFCRLFDYAKMGRIKIIVTGAVLPRNLSFCDDRFKGKLSGALIHKICKMNSDLAFSIVEAKCQSMNLNLAQTAKDLVAHSFDFNVYGLESALYKLKSYSDIYKKEIDLEIALHELKSLGRVLDRDDNCQKIIGRVASYFRVDKDDILSPVRRKEVVYARHMAMFILKEKNGLNIMRIADLFGRDHSSIIYGISRMKLEIEKDPELSKIVHNLI